MMRGMMVLICMAVVVLLSGAPALAELADVRLRSGVWLRGDVYQSEEGIRLRNRLGEVFIAAEQVVDIIPVTAPAGDGEAADAPTAPGDEDEELSPAPFLSERDMNRLKLGELTLDGPAEKVRPRFLRGPRQEELPREVLEVLRKRPDFDPRWETTLLRGQPDEKLQLIVRQTGMEHADRMDVRGDPRAYEMFERNVLKLVDKSCARSGCHAGTGARVFRFPIGSARNDKYVYTSFILLDQMETQYGPLIDRMNPEASTLVFYMLPRENNPRPHPQTEKGPAFRAVLRDHNDANYRAVVDWINYLLVPRPDYGLEYENPYRGPFKRLTPRASDDKPE